MDNKDVEAGVDNTVDFISKIWNGVEAALNVIPPIVIGFIVLAIFIMWLIHKVRS